MSGIASTIKLGRPKAEISFTGSIEMPDGLDMQVPNVAAHVENALGETFSRIRRRRKPKFSIKVPKVTSTLASQLESLRNIVDTFLAFVWANAEAVFSDRYVLDTTTTLTLNSSPETLLGKAYKDAGGADTDIIVITGVFTTYSASGAQAGTNYYTGGSYNSQTRVITLGSSPGAAGTAVYVNWTYNGALVKIGSLKKHHSGGEMSGSSPLWDVSLELEGI